MSGTFLKIDVPPHPVSCRGLGNVNITSRFKGSGHAVVWFSPITQTTARPLIVYRKLSKGSAWIKAALPCRCGTHYGGVAEGVIKAAFGNNISFEYDDNITSEDIFAYSYGSFVVELEEYPGEGVLLGKTRDNGYIAFGSSRIELERLYKEYESVLEPVYPSKVKQENREIPELTYVSNVKPVSSVKVASPRVLIPVFPGTNCELRLPQRPLKRAGAKPEFSL